MSTITSEQEQKIAEFVNNHTLAAGLGTEESPCSIAAINLALTGELTDKIPDCMSKVIGHFIIRMQDIMPRKMRNTKKWKRLLPLAAGTGRDFQKEHNRLDIINDLNWKLLELLKPVVDENGEWDVMIAERDYHLLRKMSSSLYYADQDDLSTALRYMCAYALTTPAPASMVIYVLDALELLIKVLKDTYVIPWREIDPGAVIKQLINA